MKRALVGIVLAAAATTPAYAFRVALPPPPPPPPRDFWQNAIEPHADEIEQITSLIRAEVIELLDNGLAETRVAWPARERVLKAALAKLRTARKLAPANPVVLAQLGRIADELGDARQAIEALETCVQVVGADRVEPAVTGRLGMIYMRLGDYDTAIRYLRLAQRPVQPAAATVAIDLANAVALAHALAVSGRLTEGIESLAGALAPTAASDPQAATAVFALAAMYDRGDRRANAADAIERLKSVLEQSNYSMTLQSGLAALRITPAEEAHYDLALFYESIDQVDEARAEWATYAASGGAFRARALEHIADLDARIPAATPPTPLPAPRPRAHSHRSRRP